MNGDKYVVIFQQIEGGGPESCVSAIAKLQLKVNSLVAQGYKPIGGVTSEQGQSFLMQVVYKDQ